MEVYSGVDINNMMARLQSKTSLSIRYIGFWDSLGDILGNIGTSQLPGYQVPLLAKLNIIFTAIFSKWILKKIRILDVRTCSFSIGAALPTTQIV